MVNYDYKNLEFIKNPYSFVGKNVSALLVRIAENHGTTSKNFPKKEGRWTLWRSHVTVVGDDQGRSFHLSTFKQHATRLSETAKEDSLFVVRNFTPTIYEKEDDDSTSTSTTTSQKKKTPLPSFRLGAGSTMSMCEEDEATKLLTNIKLAQSGKQQANRRKRLLDEDGEKSDIDPDDLDQAVETLDEVHEFINKYSRAVDVFVRHYKKTRITKSGTTNEEDSDINDDVRKKNDEDMESNNEEENEEGRSEKEKSDEEESGSDNDDVPIVDVKPHTKQITNASVRRNSDSKPKGKNRK
jgi:hypothetical protein